MSEPKSVSLDYFAIFREVRKKDRETISTSAGTLGELYEELRERYHFLLPQASLRVAVNDEFASWDSLLSEGDRVTFIPPVAGG
ncbi:MAG: MoaD/ThiS family protein [Trueperaceae bacterium]